MDSTQSQLDRPARRSSRPIVGPIILIGFGALFLAQNLGYINGTLWYNIWRFWPLLLVLVGVEIIFGRSGRLGTLVTAAVAVAAVGIVAWAGVTGQVPYWSDGWRVNAAAASMTTDSVVEELGDIDRATIDLRHSAGRLQVGALNEDSGRLVEAELAHPDGRSISRRFDRKGDSADLRLRDTNQNDFPFVGNGYDNLWAVNLSPRVPLELQIETGASEMVLDLRHLLVTQLRIETGASAVQVTLPQAAGTTTATIKAGAAGVDITVPEGVAARIQQRGGLSGVSIDEGKFPRVGDHYQSPGFDSAENKVYLTVETGVSGVTIRGE